MNDGRYVYETKRQGRIAHHHTDATVPHIVALLGSTFHAAKIGTFSETSKYFAENLHNCRYVRLLFLRLVAIFAAEIADFFF